MNFIKTEFEDLWIIEPLLKEDARGYFAETYKKIEFEKRKLKVDFIQDNESKSSFGVLRGLHYQEGEAAQAKLARVTEGKILDVVVDIRKDSPTFGRYQMMELSAENRRQFFIPRGFAHSFLVLSETAVVSYKVDNVYTPEAERTIFCFDPDLNIPWPLDQSQLILSEKDKKGKLFKDICV